MEKDLHVLIYGFPFPYKTAKEHGDACLKYVKERDLSNTVNFGKVENNEQTVFTRKN
jgi:hypothetical protein